MAAIWLNEMSDMSVLWLKVRRTTALIRMNCSVKPWSHWRNSVIFSITAVLCSFWPLLQFLHTFQDSKMFFKWNVTWFCLQIYTKLIRFHCTFAAYLLTLMFISQLELDVSTVVKVTAFCGNAAVQGRCDFAGKTEGKENFNKLCWKFSLEVFHSFYPQRSCIATPASKTPAASP